MAEQLKFRAGLVTFVIILITTGAAELAFAYFTFRSSGREQFGDVRLSNGWVTEWTYILVIGPPSAGLVGGVIAYFGAGRALLPLSNITRIARQIGNGAVSERVPVEGEKEIQELAQAINLIAEKFQYVDEHRRSLLAEVTHELRRPLNNVQGYAEMVQQQVMTFAGTIQESTAAMNRQVEALSRQVDDLRILADADSGDLVLKRAPEQVSDVLGMATEGYETSALENGVLITTDIQPSLPLIYVDRARIYQVIGNLLDNALAHMPEGGEIKVAAVQQNEMVLISVEDSGSGIPENAMPHIFERFYSGDSERERKSGGFGLGLTVAKQIVESHGGRIWVESREGSGSTFSLTVPVHQQEIRHRLRPAFHSEPMSRT